MANIEELQRALRQGSDAKARLSGLDEQYQQAQDRGVATTKKDQYGQVSPLSVLADVVGQSRSRRDMRELAPQREAARSNIAQHENAQGLFNAVRQQEQDSQIQANWTDDYAFKIAQQAEVAKQNQIKNEQFTTTAANKEEAALKLATAKLNARDTTDRFNPHTGKVERLEEGPNGGLYRNGVKIDDQHLYELAPNREQQVVGFGTDNKHVDKLAVDAMKRIDQVARVHNMSLSLTDVDRKSMDSLTNQFLDVGIDMLSPDSMAPLIRDKLTNYSVPVKQFLTNLASLGAKERHELFGAALTTAELKSSSEFSPKINGVPLDVIESRLDRMYGEGRTELQTFDKFVGSGAKNYSSIYENDEGVAATRWRDNATTGGLRKGPTGNTDEVRARIANLKAQLAKINAEGGVE